MLMVSAGLAVDQIIEELLPHLEHGDLIIDGGNSHFKDTDARAKALAEKAIHFLGVGISGGEQGARFGPSMMPGGHKDAYERVRTIFEAIAAKVNGDTCVTYLGPGSAGHYVKMVHNGIEYGLMQLIAETYDFMKRCLGLSNDDLADIHQEWNQGVLQSFLVEITSTIFRQVDEITGQRLIDQILDRARQKGTGKWTSQDAMDSASAGPHHRLRGGHAGHVRVQGAAGGSGPGLVNPGSGEWGRGQDFRSSASPCVARCHDPYLCARDGSLERSFRGVRV